MTTEDCKNKIVEELIERGLPSSHVLCNKKNWKRVSKKQRGSYIVRTFHYQDPDDSSKDTVGILSMCDAAQVIEKNNHLAVVDESQLEDLLAMEIPTLPDGITIEDLLIYQAKRIKHCGDYGQLFYRDRDKSVIWVAGDADGDEDSGHTSFEEIERLFRGVTGILEVEIADEWIPEGDEWKDLGNHGIIV